MKYLAITAILSIISVIGVSEKEKKNIEKAVQVQHLEFEPIFINVKR